VDFSRLPITETSRMTNTVGLLQLLLSSHVTRHLLSGHLPPPPKTTVAYICLWSGLPQARVSYGGMCPGRGQMSSTGADDGRPYRAYATPATPACCCSGRLRVNRHTWLSALVDRGRRAVAAAASLGLGLLPTRCRQPIALRHSRHLICKCVTSPFLKI